VFALAAMPISARFQFIRDMALRGHLVCTSVLPNSQNGRIKIKIRIKHVVSSMSDFAMLGIVKNLHSLEALCIGFACIDRGHRHSTGDIDIGMWLSPMVSAEVVAVGQQRDAPIDVDAMPAFKSSLIGVIDNGPRDRDDACLPSQSFDAVRVISGWMPLPDNFMRSLHLRFPAYWHSETDRATRSQRKAWELDPCELPARTLVNIHYGLNTYTGRVLRSGFGAYSSYYRVFTDHDQQDSWIEKWRCVAVGDAPSRLPRGVSPGGPT
jgi:hypothetical protein